jgi:hypothetical protein
MKFINKVFMASLLLLGLVSSACRGPNLPNDDFSNSNSGWGTGTDEKSSVEYANGGLQIIVHQPSFVTWSTPGTGSYENIHMEAGVRNDSTDPEAMFGFVCNEQGTTDSFYYAGVSPDGYYAFVKSAEEGEDVYLKEGSSEVISASPSSMRLGLDCGNGSMTLYVNGQRIDSVSDSTYTSGAIGLFAASDDEPSGANVNFDDFVTTKLGE